MRRTVLYGLAALSLAAAARAETEGARDELAVDGIVRVARPRLAQAQPPPDVPPVNGEATPAAPREESEAAPDAEQSLRAEPEVRASQAPAFNTRPTPTPDRAALVESTIRPVDDPRRTQTPPHWTGDIEPPGRPEWVDRYLESHENFLQPILVPPVHPEFAARLVNTGGWNDQRGAGGEVDQILYLAAYLVEIYAPMITMRSSDTFGVDHFRTNLHVPFAYGGRHAIAAWIGGEIPVRGRWKDDSGYSAHLGYAFASEAFGAQVRAGYGVDRLIGEVDADFEPTVLADVTVGVHLGRHLSLIGQADGKKLIGQDEAGLRVWPAVRWYPLERRTLSVGVGGQLWFTRDDDEWFNRRWGGFVDLWYLFL